MRPEDPDRQGIGESLTADGRGGQIINLAVLVDIRRR